MLANQAQAVQCCLSYIEQLFETHWIFLPFVHPLIDILSLKLS